MNRILILVPTFAPTGPVKGAAALANLLAETRTNDVHFIALRSDGIGHGTPLSPDVKESILDIKPGIFSYKKFKAKLDPLVLNTNTTLISFCFSADMYTAFYRTDAKKICSIRGDLKQNYRYDYGISGLVLALIHHSLLHRFDEVLALNESMKANLNKTLQRETVIIPNFIDETHNSKFLSVKSNHKCINVAFVGGLTRRKQPHLVVWVINELIKSGFQASALIIGDGPELKRLQKQINNLKLDKNISLLGHQNYPQKYISQSDVFLLPSLSEGTSRAAMEALFLGIPCIMRDVDGNSELIQNGRNGYLFSHPSELPKLVLKCFDISQNIERQNMLPTEFRKTAVKMRLQSLLLGK